MCSAGAHEAAFLFAVAAFEIETGRLQAGATGKGICEISWPAGMDYHGCPHLISAQA